MKKYLSIIELYAKSTVYKILAVISLSWIIQAFLFNKVLGLVDYEKIPLGFEAHIYQSKIGFVFAACFIACCVILCLVGCDFSSKSSYTFSRLTITEKQAFICSFAYNITVFIILLFSQIIIIALLYVMYYLFITKSFDVDSYFINHQTLFLSVYRDDFVGSVMPLHDVVKIIKNTVSVICMSFTCAAFPFMQRKGKICFEALAAAVLILLTFQTDFLDYEVNIFSAAASVVICYICFCRCKAQKGCD